LSTSNPDKFSREKRYYRKDGSVVWVNLTVSMMCKADGSPGYFISVIEDISARKQVEENLRESEEKYRTLFESINQGFCTIEVLFDKDEKPVDYRFVVVNPAFERQTGIENAVGRRMREIAIAPLRHVAAPQTRIHPAADSRGAAP
jgi:PAS domain-containing protein